MNANQYLVDCSCFFNSTHHFKDSSFCSVSTNRLCRVSLRFTLGRVSLRFTQGLKYKFDLMILYCNELSQGNL